MSKKSFWHMSWFILVSETKYSDLSKLREQQQLEEAGQITPEPGNRVWNPSQGMVPPTVGRSSHPTGMHRGLDFIKLTLETSHHIHEILPHLKATVSFLNAFLPAISHFTNSLSPPLSPAYKCPFPFCSPLWTECLKRWDTRPGFSVLFSDISPYLALGMFLGPIERLWLSVTFTFLSLW